MNLPRPSDRALFAAILVAAFGLRAVSLGGADLTTDEIQTLHAVRLPAGELVAERLGAGHVPLYFVLLKGWCALFGTSQLALRLPSALVGTALLVPALSLFRRLAGERAAWWGTALLAVHPLFVELSREARMYPLVGLAALVVADRAAATLDGERPGASLWAAAAAGPLLHATWGVAMLPLAAWLALERRAAPSETRRSSLAVLAGLAASLAVLAAALAFAAPQHQELTRRPWPREIGVFVLRIFAGSDLGRFHDAALCLALVVGWAPALIVGFSFADGRERRFAAWIGVGVPVVSVAAGVLGSVPWGPARYLAFGAMGFVLLAANAARPHRPPAAATLVFLCLSLTLLSIGQISRHRTAWSEAAAVLRFDAAPVVVDDESARIVLSHYLGRDVSVGAPPPGATAWRRAVLDVRDDVRRVQITAGPAPR